MMGENPRHGSCVNRSSTRSPTNRTQVSTSSPPPVDMCTPAFQIEEHLNGVYEKRIAEIEQLASGDANLKEVTYVEWINMLRQVNRTLIINVQDLQHETSERLSLLQRKVGSSCRFSQDSELNKYRNDVGALIQLVRNGRRNADWSVDKLHFETVTESDIFGNEMSYCEPTMKSEPETTNVACSTEEKANFECQKAKLTANVKALAFEVAEKHDEIRDLKKQILSMEDEIQNAQKKIQLKDDVIKELRNDLRSLPKCNNLWGVTSSNTSRMSIKSSESDVSSICTPGEPSNNKESSICGPVNALHISFPEEDNDQEELIKRIKEEFSQLRRNYDQNIDEQTRAMDEQYNRFSGMIDQLSKTSSNLQKKLKFYRQKLLDLGNPQSARTLTNSSDVDSGISTDSDADVKNINSIRERLCCLTEETQRLVREQQNMQMKLADANGKAKAKSDLLEKASKALQEVADLLENTMHKPIAYENIFSECQTTPENPIVEAVDELIKDLMEKNKIIDELRSKISNTDGMNQGQEHCGNQLRCDVNESMPTRATATGLIQNEKLREHFLKQAERYQTEEEKEDNEEHKSEYLRIIDDLSSELNTLSSQVNMVQKDFLADEIAKQFENSLKGLETQNDLLQSTVENLIGERDTIERTLKAQNEDLKMKLCARDEELRDLRHQLSELERRPCQVCGNKSPMVDPKSHRREEMGTDSVDELQQLHELRRRGKTVEMLKSENAKLKKDLSETRINQGRMKLLRRCGAMASAPVEKPDELLSRLAAIEEDNHEKTKSLQKAQKEVSNLKQEVDNLRLAEEAFNKERELLQFECITLKETLASQTGRQKSLLDQLQWTTDELNAAKNELQGAHQQINRLRSVYHEEAKRLQDQKVDMLEKYNSLVDDFNKLGLEYKKVVQIEEEMRDQLKTFHAWKEEQKKSELQNQLLKDHIQKTQVDRVNLLKLLYETCDQNQQFLQLYDNFSRNQINGNQSTNGASGCYPTGPAYDHISKVIESARRASRRLSQQASVLQDEASCIFSKNERTDTQRDHDDNR